MATNNFKIFDEDSNNILTNAEYSNDTARKEGLSYGTVASSKLHNKIYHQVSTMAYAIAKVLADGGRDADDLNPTILSDNIKALFANSELKKSLAGVATTGSFKDLSDIPSNISNLKTVAITGKFSDLLEKPDFLPADMSSNSIVFKADANHKTYGTTTTAVSLIDSASNTLIFRGGNSSARGTTTNDLNIASPKGVGFINSNKDVPATYGQVTVAIDTTNSTVTANTFVGSLSGTASSAKYADYAEFFPRGEQTEVGDIIMLDLSAEEERYVKAVQDSTTVVGIHSENFGFIVGGDEVEHTDMKDLIEKNSDKFIPVGLAGRVPVKFMGKSAKGKRVVPSSIPGVGRGFIYGMDSPDSVVGFLVEEDDRTDTRLLKVMLRK